jgi:hypothetical protein
MTSVGWACHRIGKLAGRIRPLIMVHTKDGAEGLVEAAQPLVLGGPIPFEA